VQARWSLRRIAKIHPHHLPKPNKTDQQGHQIVRRKSVAKSTKRLNSGFEAGLLLTQNKSNRLHSDSLRE
jgi:hypothetical protein